jgi:glycerophosphodiester phosphodiesterase
LDLGAKLDALERELRSNDPSREKRAQRMLVKEVCPELGWLREYVVLNYTAVVKAVKKGNKNLGHNTHAVQLLAGEPIFCSLGLAKLVTRAEMLTVHAAPASERRIADYCCPICDEVLSNPIMLPCTHRFCFKCITTVHDDEESRVDRQKSSGPMDVRGLKGALNRGACPVCREPNMNDESSLRVDDALDEFIKQHFHEEGVDEGFEWHPDANDASAEVKAEGTAKGSPRRTHRRASSNDWRRREEKEKRRSNSEHPNGIPKALIISLAGCRSDAMLVSDAPTMSSFVRGLGCFSFHMQHTWNGCGNAPSDAMMPLLTGTKVPDKGDASPASLSVFSRLGEVRSWVRVAAAVGGARDLASTISAENSAKLLTSPSADDAEAAAAAAEALRAKDGEDVIYVHLSGVQDAGAVHGYGPHVPEYRAAVETADTRISKVMTALRERRATYPREDWLVVVSSPAGGTSRSDMPVTMQGHFDAADWNGGGGRQLRAAGVTGFDSLPQHATGWVLVDVCAEPGFAGGAMSDGRACGELLPPPRDVDVAPTLLEHFGVAPRREWGLDGNHLLASRRTDTVLEDEFTRTQLSVDGRDEADFEFSNGFSVSSRQSSGSPRARGLSLETFDVEMSPGGSESSASDATAAEGSNGMTGSSSQGATATAAATTDGASKTSVALSARGDESSRRERQRKTSSLSAPGPFASHLPGLFEPTGCAVVGHRGFGMNRAPGRGIRENTVASFIAAHGSGAGWCEFDVQVTSDGVPVLFHDNMLLVRYGFGAIQQLSIRELDLAELKAASRAAIATAKAAAAGAPEAVAAVAGLDAPVSVKALKKHEKRASEDEEEEDDDDDENEAQELDIVVFYRKFPASAGNPPEPLPWVMEVEDEIPTLEELMLHAPPELGLSMELKFDEHNPCATPRLVAELRAVLSVCRQHPSRRILFSSFDPDAALIMRALQGLYPVMMISDCAPHHADPRRRSVAAAKKTALDGGLCGLVLDVKVLADGPTVADDVRSSGLLLGTYGAENDDKPLASKQVEWGMCLVCTDNVAALAGMFNSPTVDQGMAEPASAPLASPSLAAAAAARKLGETELDAVLRAPWYKLSEDGKNGTRGAVSFSSLVGARDGNATDSNAFRRKPGNVLGRIGTAEALSALAKGAAAGLTEVAEEAKNEGFAVHSRTVTLTDRQPKANRAGPSQRAGVTSKGYWAVFPKYMPAPRGAEHAGSVAGKAFAVKPVPHP